MPKISTYPIALSMANGDVILFDQAAGGPTTKIITYDNFLAGRAPAPPNDATKFLSGTVPPTYAVPPYPVASNNPLALSVVTAPTTFNNSNAETTVFTYTLPGNTLSTNNLLRIRQWFVGLNNSGGGVTFTVKVKYGGTAFFTTAHSPASSATPFYFYYDGYLKANAATNSQIGTGQLMYNAAGALAAVDVIDTTIAIDSTANQAVIITIQFTVANANIIATTRETTLELMTHIP